MGPSRTASAFAVHLLIAARSSTPTISSNEITIWWVSMAMPESRPTSHEHPERPTQDAVPDPGRVPDGVVGPRRLRDLPMLHRRVATRAPGFGIPFEIEAEFTIRPTTR